MKSNVAQLADIYVRTFKLNGYTWYSVKDLMRAFNMTYNQFKKMNEAGVIKMHTKTMLNHNNQTRKENVIHHKHLFRVAIEGRNKMCDDFKIWLCSELAINKAEEIPTSGEEEINPILDFYILTHKKL